MTLSWLWWTIPLSVIGVVVVVFNTSRLIANHKEHLARVPVVDAQDVSIAASGPMLLHGEGPRATNAFADLDFQLTSTKDGHVVRLVKPHFKTSSSGTSRSRLSLRSFEIEEAGVFRLEVLGLAATRTESDAPIEIVVTRDRRKWMAGTIVGLTFGAIAFLGGLALSIAVWFKRVA